MLQYCNWQGEKIYFLRFTISPYALSTSCIKLLFHRLKIRLLRGILMGSPMVLIVTLGQKYNVDERPTVVLYTYYIRLITMQSHQTQEKQKTMEYIIKKVVIIRSV